MSEQQINMKCVIVVNAALSAGIVANTAACLGFSLGSTLPQEMGPQQKDADGVTHGGLLNIPLPILTATAEQVKTIANLAYSTDDLVVFDMSDIAQQSKTQEDYGNTLARTKNANLKYWGVAIYGDKKIINKMTGNLRLFGR